MPLLRVIDLCEQLAQKALLGDLARFELVIFVSPAAVQTVLAHVGEGWPATAAPVVVGPGSLQYLSANGLDRHPQLLCAPGPVHDAESLLSMPRMHAVAGQHVMLVRACGGNQRIEAELAARGARVAVLEAYERHPVALEPAALGTLNCWLAQHADGAVPPPFVHLGSVDAASRLANELPPAVLGARALVFHPRIRDCAQAAGWRELRLIAPGLEALCEAIESDNSPAEPSRGHGATAPRSTGIECD